MSDLILLYKHSLVGAELDSVTRVQPPRCYPGTREALRNEITAWLVGNGQQQNMLWLFGQPGVGKSAVAQTIAEYAAECGFLGAALFLSRTKKVDDPGRLIISVSYQLAVRSLPYQRLIIEVMKGDPTILEKDKRTQFKKLLVEPFSTLKRQGEDSKKLLVIIDALDECREDTEQIDFIRLVAEDLKSSAPLPLLWMICSRPERHLKKLFANDSFLDMCWKRDLLTWRSQWS